jgi:hypothetical protein
MNYNGIKIIPAKTIRIVPSTTLSVSSNNTTPEMNGTNAEKRIINNITTILVFFLLNSVRVMVISPLYIFIL